MTAIAKAICCVFISLKCKFGAILASKVCTKVTLLVSHLDTIDLCRLGQINYWPEPESLIGAPATAQKMWALDLCRLRAQDDLQVSTCIRTPCLCTN